MKTWNKIMGQNVYTQLNFRHKSFKNPSRGVPRGLSRFLIDYNNSLVTIRITETKIFNAN